MKTSILVFAAMALTVGSACAAPQQNSPPANGEPYSAPDPQYAPMKSEPVLPETAYQQPSFSTAAFEAKSSPPEIAAAMEPYKAPDPVD